MEHRTEREKMLAGELYIASDPELVAMHKRAIRLIRVLNQTTGEELAERETLLRELLGAVGQGAYIEPPFYCDYGSHIFLADRIYMNFNCVILDCNRVHIGENTMLGPSVQIYTATHPLQAAERLKGPELAYPITIGRNVWIGGGAIIGPGVTIGDNTTIGAGSVIVKDIPADVFAAGNPCRVIRQLTPEEAEK
ncbi:MAG: sugar O-acetyltransferase [Ardenticatenales bacterium]|nr:sugar O-acetyltransferase [Ardenticatenales bacterium]